MSAFDHDGTPDDMPREGEGDLFDRFEDELPDPWSEVTPAPSTSPRRTDPQSTPSQSTPPQSDALVVTRKVPPRRAEPPAPPPPATAPGIPTPERRYPKMRALLREPDQVPEGIEPLPAPKPPPVPGTFFPAPRAPLMRKAPEDLDEMLATMAEGLLVGESADGGTEVRVTLRDEFFAGTELRITAGGGNIRAVLVPPDRETYLSLNGKIDELHERLKERGLEVRELRVQEP